MYPSHYTIKRFLQEYIIFTSLGYAFSRSLPSANNRPTPQFEHHFQSNLAVHPFYYGLPNSQAYWPHEPVGTFFDKKRGILRSFPGGGVPVLVDHHKRCSSNFVGIKPHPNQRQYYYVCKPDCVIFGKCQNLQSFDATKAQCIPYPTPDYSPVCVKPGRFPISTDCSIYYRCDADLKAHIHSCPRNTIFSPHNEKCICGAHCNPTKVSLHSSHIPQDCEHKFPPCLQNGTFRTPTDCSLYYTCVKQEGSLYLQTRFKCPELEFFDPAKGTCRPQHEVACDSIQLSELVFPRPPPLPHLPVIYPAHYSMDSLDDSDYPTEYSLSCSKEDTISASVSSNERTMSDSSVQATTSKTTKFSASLTTSPSKQMVDTSSENSIEIITHTPTSFPAFVLGVTSTESVLQTNSSPTRNSNAIILSSTSPPITIGDTSQSPILSPEVASAKTFAPKAVPTTNSVVVGAVTPTTPSINPAILGSSPDIISDQSSSPIDFVPFVPTKLQTSSSTSAFSSTASSILHSSRTKHSTPLSTTISMLPRDFSTSTTNTRLKSTAEITTTPLVPSSIIPSSSTTFSSSTAEDRFLPTKSHTSTSLINTLHMSSPTVHPSSVEIITTGTVPISASQPHTSLPITTLFSPDSTTTELPTIHSRTIQTSMHTDPLILPPVTSSLKEEITAMPPNTTTTTNFSVTTSSLLDDSSPLSTVESIDVTKIKPTVSTSTSETTPDPITNTLNHNEIRSIRSSLLIKPIKSNENNVFEQTVNSEYISNEFENPGFYDDYESDFETTEVSTTDKCVQSGVLSDRNKTLNTSEKSKSKDTECIMNDLHDANDVSYYEDNGDSFEATFSSTVSALHEESIATSQSTRLMLNTTVRSAKRNVPKHNFELHNQSITTYQQLNIEPNKLDEINVEKPLFKNSSKNFSDDLETITENITGPTKVHNSLKNIFAKPNDKEFSIITFEDSTDTELTTEAPKINSKSIENSTIIVSSFNTDNQLEDSMSTMQPLEVANQSTAKEMESFTESSKAGHIAAVKRDADLGDSEDVDSQISVSKSLMLKESSWKSQNNTKPKNSQIVSKLKEKMLNNKQNKNINEIFKSDDDGTTNTKTKSEISELQTSAVKKISMTVNSTNTKQDKESESSSKISTLQTTMKAIKKKIEPLTTTEPTTLKKARQVRGKINNKFEYSNEYSTSSENQVFITDSSVEAHLSNFTTEMKIGKITEATPKATAEAKVVSAENLHSKHHHISKDLIEPSLKSSTDSTNTEVNLTVRDKARFNDTQQLKSAKNSTKSVETRPTELSLARGKVIKEPCDLGTPPLTPLKIRTYSKEIELNHSNTNSMDAYSSKFEVRVPRTYEPIHDADIENDRKFANSVQISKLVDILLPPSTDNPAQDLKIGQNSSCVTTGDTLAQTKHLNPKEFISKHVKSAGSIMESAEPESPLGSLEKSTGLVRICDPFQNNISNEGNKQFSNSKFDTSRPLSARLPVIRSNVTCKTHTSDLPLSSFKLFSTKHSQSTTTQNTITSTTEETVENTTVGTTHVDIKFQDNLVNIKSNDLRITRNVQKTNTLQDTPQTYKRTFRMKTPGSNSNSEPVTEFPIHATDIPKLEVVVFGNLDLTVLYCPKDCTKQHEHKYDKKVFGDQHVVGIQWDPAKSKKTMSIQTV
ncbi:uncharacterized protein LOC105230725 [Bactrocera dorsalis]|uniref:Uncharacterized protein LOC105230725 n=1 Tax=Bactrocera dorsalis TaxID=27457 RepID=A0A6I9W027_BACDO|nr:uncharacterized protein LOC105230725 [Bactrocera dorsalis]